MKSSNLEEKVISILKENKIRFEREKTFPNLKKHNHNLRFDFYIPERNCCIEVQGAQHYKFIRPFHKNRQDLLKQQEYDRFKISWCLSNNIKLFVIPYWEIEKINNLENLFQLKFIAKNKWKNDFDFRDFNCNK